MGKILKDVVELVERDGVKIWHQEYETELSDEEIEQNKKVLSLNINFLKEQIELHNVENKLKDKAEKLEFQREVLRESLKNFEKYIKKEVDDLIKSKAVRKQEIFEFIRNFDNIKEQELNKLKVQTEAMLDQYKEQLEDNEKKLRQYKD
jgi:uncharacterized protein with NAD-binding domain and iron-sulfur cluster